MQDRRSFLPLHTSLPKEMKSLNAHEQLIDLRDARSSLCQPWRPYMPIPGQVTSPTMRRVKIKGHGVV
jgi:hypothetical protein